MAFFSNNSKDGCNYFVPASVLRVLCAYIGELTYMLIFCSPKKDILNVECLYRN